MTKRELLDKMADLREQIDNDRGGDNGILVDKLRELEHEYLERFS